MISAYNDSKIASQKSKKKGYRIKKISAVSLKLFEVLLLF